MIEWIITGIILFVVGLIAILFFPRYVVVPPHEAHVVVTRGKGRRLFSSRKDIKASSYFFIPLIHKRAILPLRNKQMVIDNIPLRDKDLAKFICDVVCWVNITDPIKAAERIGSQKRLTEFSGIEDDIMNLVKAVTRNSSMKMDLVRLMSERLEFSRKISEEIATSIGDWGVELVDLECIHFIDQAPYTVIHDLEQRQAAQINSTTRKLVAERNKEAVVVEAQAKRTEEVTIAETDEEFRKRQLQRDEEVGKRNQEKEMIIAEAQRKANEKKVESEKTYVVGKAKYEAEAVVEKAVGDRDAKKAEGEGLGEYTRRTGTAEADVIQKKGEAEGIAIEKKALAQKKYETPQALAVELFGRVVDGYVDIQKSMWENMGGALEKADVKVISTGEEGEIFGIPIGAKTGVALGGMFEALKESSGIDLGEMIKDVFEGTKEVAKEVFGKSKEESKKKRPRSGK